MAQPTVSVVSSCLSLLTGFCCTQSGRLPQESGTSSPAQDLIILLPVASIIARLTVWWLNRKIIRPQGNSRPGRISYSFFIFYFFPIQPNQSCNTETGRSIKATPPDFLRWEIWKKDRGVSMCGFFPGNSAAPKNRSKQRPLQKMALMYWCQHFFMKRNQMWMNR